MKLYMLRSHFSLIWEDRPGGKDFCHLANDRLSISRKKRTLGLRNPFILLTILELYGFAEVELSMNLSFQLYLSPFSNITGRLESRCSMPLLWKPTDSAIYNDPGQINSFLELLLST